MTDLTTQPNMLGLALVVWASIAALVVVFIALVKRGPHH